jgi:alkaline phosphatase D
MLDLSNLDEAVRHEGGVSRRLFLAYAASLYALPVIGSRARAAARSARFADDPFSVGVASGDPTERGVVLWTRLAPKPLEPGGGLPPENVEVAWEIASDEAMNHVVSRGTAVATPQLAHSVHVEVDELRPDRWYWYRFRAGDAESPIGRTRTMPASGSSPGEVRLGFASCQHYESGLFTAYEHMAQDELDVVFHLGDYIYEGGAEAGRVRRHAGDRELNSLDDYRIRHAQYKTDPLLQAAHGRSPWMVAWDDHELDNNCAGEFCQDADVDPVAFLNRRAGAYQAYYEMMPLRRTSLPKGPSMQLYRKASFGRLAEFLVLDTRQFRTDQPNGDGRSDLNDATFAPDGTMVGARQMDWLQQSLIASRATWNVLAQQVLMGLVDVSAGNELYAMDTWSGYGYERARILKFLKDRKIANPVVLTGDTHSNWVNDLHVDDRRPETPIVATEIGGTSISSGGNGVQKSKWSREVMAWNPNVRFQNSERGYVRCTITPEHWRTDFQVVEDITRPGAPAITRASYVVEAGTPGAEPA